MQQDEGDDFAPSRVAAPRVAKTSAKRTAGCKQDPKLVARVIELARNGGDLSDIDSALSREGACAFLALKYLER